MTQLDVHPAAVPPVRLHGRRAAPTRQLPSVFWPIAAMVAMVPVLAVLLVALFS